MTLISALRDGTSALRQDQLALNATADNISNQNTAGYARRQVTWTTRDSVSIGLSTGMRMPIANITAQRDSVADRGVQQAQSDASAAGSRKSALNSLQSVFALDSSGDESSGISTSLNAFFSAVSALASDPNGAVSRQTLFSATQAVVGAFHQVAADLQQQSSSLDDSVRDDVGSVNGLTQSIAALNGQIRALPVGAERDGLIDTRTAQIDDLSKLVELSQTTNSDGSINLATINGAPLVSGDRSQSLHATVVSGTLHVFSAGNDVTAGLGGGSIGGAVAVRDGALHDTSGKLDELASSFATAVNATNTAGKLADGSAGQPIFTLPAGTANTAALLSLNATDGSAFAAASSTEGGGGNSNANAMAALRNAKNSSGATFAQVISSVISSIGIAASASQTSATTTNAALTQASAQRDAVSGISLDTEAANLTQYQRSYQAEAKLLAVLNEVMASSINLGSNTTVS